MYLINILLPISILFIGLLLAKRPPKKINHFYGYRTTRSMESQEAWEFANKYMGRLWFWLGLGLLPLSFFSSIIVEKKFLDFMPKFTILLTIIQLILIIIPIFFVEKALKKEFN